MLVKITLLSILLGIIMIAVLWYYVQLFLLLLRRRNEAIYLPSFTKHLFLMRGQLPLSRGKTIVDLGCGDGKALRFFAREYGLKCEWYDINRFAIYYGRIVNWLKWYHIHLFHSNFLGADLRGADYVYLYLFPEQMVIIEDWFFSAIQEGTVVISNTFQFQKHTPFDIIKGRKWKSRIFLYKK